MAQDTFSGIGNYVLDVNAELVSQSKSALTSTIYWRMLVIKNGTTGHVAWGNTNSTAQVDSSIGRRWTDSSVEYNFQNGSMSGTFTIADGTFTVKHNSNGEASYYVAGSMNLIQLGNASASTGWRALPKIQTATIPAAPTSKGLDQIDMDSMRYRFSGNSNGGSAILEWQIGWGTASNTPQAYLKSTGTSTFNGLKPYTTYYFWSRGRNSVGWGPWSARSSARTLSGARVRQNGVWKNAIPYVKVNGAWKLAQPYSKINGIWRKSI
ncbi:minor tail protein [Arthrobacter phage Ingrid]|nr:minor tail protein [Arthrobacter phage Ingrid]QFG11012.1 minor tail protein [Arthrobacter phage Loretta]